MECIYFPELDKNSKDLYISGSEAKHLKALRLKPGEEIQITNGKGLSAGSILIKEEPAGFLIQVTDLQENTGELPYSFALAIGILNDRNRFEFALEKAVELGITDFYPLITEFTEKRNRLSGVFNKNIN